MRRYLFAVVFLVSVVVSYFIWDNLPEYLKRGGPLLILGMTCFFLVFTYSVERLLVLWRAEGRITSATFVRNIRAALQEKNLAQAIQTCRTQGGSLGNIVGAGLERYQTMPRSTSEERRMDETRRAFEDAAALESPILERNLTALSTIASIATLLGLLGTTIGMIRAFQAMSRAGAPDATQLAIGISEALVNTALGLTTAIIGIVLYNYFSTRVDSFNASVEEASLEVLQLLRRGEA
jgi:biopolymer transport protein ExbB